MACNPHLSLLPLAAALCVGCTIEKDLLTDGDSGDPGTSTGDASGDSTDAVTTGADDECPVTAAPPAWDIVFTFNDPPDDGETTGGGETFGEQREATCGVLAVAGAGVVTLELSCAYPADGENVEPRAHTLEFTLPAGASLDLAVGDTVDLLYRESGGFEQPTRWHLGLHRGGAAVVLATRAISEQFGECGIDVDMVADYAAVGLVISHASCTPATSDRFDFTVDGATSSLWHGNFGAVAGGLVGVLTDARHEQPSPGAVNCYYDVLVYRPAD